MDSKAWRNWRPVEDRDIFAASIAEGRRQRPALSLVRSSGAGVSAGIASGTGADLREDAWLLLSMALRGFERQQFRSPHDAARAFDDMFDTALARLAGPGLPAGGWGVCAVALLPHWDVFCFACRGDAVLWRRKRGGPFRAVAPVCADGAADLRGPGKVALAGAVEAGRSMRGSAVRAGSADPLVMLAPSDRLILATGPVAAIAEEELAASIRRLAAPRVAGGILRAVPAGEAGAGASAMIVTMPGAGSRRKVDGTGLVRPAATPGAFAVAAE
ncbi:hypothetical protein [Sphingomonas colocasiae]|uniref:Protein phosphatase 2C domain-containing protein n=1 Tax=Sphingomonas colocasiae TaxID=1848973 RepID=A0ABS7PRY4_9SPHN|nr:hypothetical protein [Sphingomonas colocasiae]MBY8823440.1 hypothetical protein [Sphingomonas colocasiae]